MFVHFLAALLFIVSVVVGIVVAATGAISTGIIIGAVGVGLAAVIAVVNGIRIARKARRAFGTWIEVD